MKLKTLIYLLIGIPAITLAQTDTLNLDSFTVTSQIVQTSLKSTNRNITVIDKATIEASPVKTIDGILQYALNIDVRSRGTFGIQADVSIRGGHYDQTLILLDGVKVNDPQTGHHSMNIPIPFSMIDKIEILQGGASRVFGPSAFSGVINIISKKPKKSGAEIGLSTAEYKTHQASILGQYVTRRFSANAAADFHTSNGYVDATNFRKNTGNILVSHDVAQGNISLNYGWLNNDFGASNFYHPKYNNQYEEVHSNLFNLVWKNNFSKKTTAVLMVNHRTHFDMYDFDNYRNTNKIDFLNFHKTQVLDLEWKFTTQNNWGKTAWGLEYRREKVKSNRIGETLSQTEEVKHWEDQFYSLGKSRENFSGFLEHSKEWNRFSFSAGTLLNHNSQYKFNLYPGIDLGYKLKESQKIYYSINRSLRFPTFTELYLNNSTVKGNALLQPEKAINQEVGYKIMNARYTASFASFYKIMEDAIDKIKRPNESTPSMENLQDMNTFGFETAHTLRISKNKITLKQIVFNYSWIHNNKKEEGFQSFYTLNYLKHKASIGGFFEPFNNLRGTIWYTYKDRAGEYNWDAETSAENFKPFGLVDIRINYTLSKFNIHLDINNVFDKKYYEHGFVIQPPRWSTIGLNYKI